MVYSHSLNASQISSLKTLIKQTTSRVSGLPFNQVIVGISDTGISLESGHHIYVTFTGLDHNQAQTIANDHDIIDLTSEIGAVTGADVTAIQGPTVETTIPNNENCGCDVDAQCINTQGHYSCSCNTGYYGNGKTCTGYMLIIIGVFAFCCSACALIWGVRKIQSTQKHSVVATNKIDDIGMQNFDGTVVV